MWQNTRKSIEVIGFIAVLVVAIALIFLEVRVYGTGFRGKTLWDWLQLLIIPLVLAVVALLFNFATTRTEQKIAAKRFEQDQQIAAQRYENDQYIALDKQREDLLQTYLDRMSELLLEKQLRTSAPDTEVRNVARVRTITILFQLDARRIGYVFAFLREAGLISNKPKSSIVSLSHADLDRINLSEVDLSRTDLSGTTFRRANLSGAYLSETNLSGTNFLGANLREADLREADLSGAFLVGADLFGAVLEKAILKEAVIMSATLRKAFLKEADLSDASLNRTDLSGAEVTEEQLKQAKSLKGATMPDGSIHP